MTKGREGRIGAGLRFRPLGLAAGLVLAAGLAACGEGEADFFPLTPGWSWGYRTVIEAHNDKGTLNEDFRSFVTNLPPEDRDGEAVTPRLHHDGRIAYYAVRADGIHRLAAPPGESGEDAADAPPDASSDAPPDASPDAPPDAYVLKFPLQPGTSWQTQSRTHLLRKKFLGSFGAIIRTFVIPLTLDHRIESVDDVVTVPAGRFEGAVRVRVSGQTLDNVGHPFGMTTIRVEATKWFAPGVGLVKSVRSEKTGPDVPFGGELVTELEVLDKGWWPW